MSPLGHVFGSGWAKPSQQRMRPVALIELGDQQSAFRLEHPIHLLHSGLLIIFCDVVQGRPFHVVEVADKIKELFEIH